MTYICVDYETNGKDPWSGPLSGYFIKLDKDLNIKDEMDVRFKLDGRWDKEAEQIHRISYKNALSYPPCIEGLEKIKSFCPKDSTLVFHARKVGNYFDLGVTKALFFKHDCYHDIYSYFPRFVSTVDALRAAVSQGQLAPIQSEKGIATYRIDVWCRRFGIDLNHHEVRSDAFACYEIFKKLKIAGIEVNPITII